MADCYQPAYRNVYMRVRRGPLNQHHLNQRYKPTTTRGHARRGDRAAQRRVDLHAGRYSWDSRPLDYREPKPRPKRKPGYRIHKDGTIQSQFEHLRKQPVLLPRERERRAQREQRARRQQRGR